MRGERVEAELPGAPPREDPLLRGAEALRLEAAPAHPAALLRRHQAGPGEHLEVLVDAGERHRERRGEVRDAPRPVAEALDDRPARRVGKRPEGVVERVGLTLKHILKYNPRQTDGSSPKEPRPDRARARPRRDRDHFSAAAISWRQIRMPWIGSKSAWRISKRSGASAAASSRSSTSSG